MNKEVAIQTPRHCSLPKLREEIISCRKCPRLVKFRERISKEKRKQFRNFQYWGRPVPGFGDPNARLLVVGLAPASHGGNRTGRVFTGDNSAKFLVRHLYESGFANHATSETRDDGLKYIDCYVTAAVRCVPPENKPLNKEIESCAPYFEEELMLLSHTKVILALGKIAFETVIDFAKKYYNIRGKFEFRHAQRYYLSRDLPVVFASFHPSPRNTNTGKLTSGMFADVLLEIRKELSV